MALLMFASSRGTPRQNGRNPAYDRDDTGHEPYYLDDHVEDDGGGGGDDDDDGYYDPADDGANSVQHQLDSMLEDEAMWDLR